MTPGPVLVVGSGGGCGASLLAGGLALAWAAAGEPAWLLELDLENGDLAGAWGLAGDRTIADLVAVAGELEPDHLRDAAEPHPSGVMVLAAPGAPGSAGPWGAASVARLVAVAGGEGRVVVDAGAGLSPVGLAAAGAAARVLVACTRTLAAARRAGRMVGALAPVGCAGRAALVAVEGPSRGELSARALGRVVGAEVAAELPWEPRAAVRLAAGDWPAGRRRGLTEAIARVAEALA